MRRAAVCALALVVSGCTAVTGTDGSTEPAGEQPTVAPSPAVAVAANVDPGAGAVPVDTRLELTAADGTFRTVTVRSSEGDLPGELAADGSSWTAAELLEPGTRYVVRTVAEDAEGQVRRTRQAFTTQELSLDEQTYPSIAPLDGETVGVGMPVIVTFDLPVTDRAAIERHLRVESSPAQTGAWHWLSDTEVHWRPREYWRPGTEVTVNADINSIPAGNGIYGQLSRTTSFTVGDAVIMKVDVAAHQMRVERNGRLLRTIPISAGKPGFTTRSGTKVIIEKFRTKNMDAATTGISPGEAEYYNIENVEYAQRVTYSGEFIHAAPWSVGSHGNANVSHGCVGMSTENAAWLYAQTSRGDVVEVVGSDRPMTLENGFGDWNLPFSEYKQGSALS